MRVAHLCESVVVLVIVVECWCWSCLLKCHAAGVVDFGVLCVNHLDHHTILGIRPIVPSTLGYACFHNFSVAPFRDPWFGQLPCNACVQARRPTSRLYTLGRNDLVYDNSVGVAPRNSVLPQPSDTAYAVQGGHHRVTGRAIYLPYRALINTLLLIVFFRWYMVFLRFNIYFQG